MFIKKLHVEDLRVIEDADIELGSGINLITGDNGAGKTSLLEAVYLLGRGKSFRHRESGHFIRAGSKRSIVTAELVKEDGSTSRLGVERFSRKIRVKQDGREVQKRSRLLRALPMQVITPKSHELIERGPEARRKFLDYGMFHVEHGYLEQLNEYNRALKQRNAALRQGQLDVARSYNGLLSSSATLIQYHRVSYIQTIDKMVGRILDQLDATFHIEFSLHPGWNTDWTLEEQLQKCESQDLKRAYTTLGIHRADLIIQSDQVLASHRLSRGQQKVLVYALKIAQSRLYLEKSNIHPILMVDDLTAELDNKHLIRVMLLLRDIGLQVLITMVATDRLPHLVDSKMFHVEHGRIVPV